MRQVHRSPPFGDVGQTPPQAMVWDTPVLGSSLKFPCTGNILRDMRSAQYVHSDWPLLSCCLRLGIPTWRDRDPHLTHLRTIIIENMSRRTQRKLYIRVDDGGDFPQSLRLLSSSITMAFKSLLTIVSLVATLAGTNGTNLMIDMHSFRRS